MSDARLTAAMRDLRSRMVSLGKDAESEIDQQLSDLDKMEKIAELQAELLDDDGGFSDMVNTFKETAKKIKEQMHSTVEAIEEEP